jgi:glycosyltransferase involved in cell wall biosynthesis/predicted Zn-dependent protease
MKTRLRCEYSQYRWAGVPTRYIDLVRYLDRSRYETDLHGTSDLEAESRLPAWLEPLQEWLKCLIARGNMPWYRLGDLGAEVDAMQSCKAQPTSIIHFMDGEHCGQFLPRRIREMGLTGVKTVATFHQPPAVISELVNDEMLRWLDAVIVVSPTQLPFFKDRVPEHKLHVVLLGVDAELFSPPERKHDNEQVVCITTGLHLRDWDTFKKVALAMPDVKFVVVTSSRVTFDKIPNLTLYSGISDTALSDIYRSADVLFLPLLDTTANNTLLEGIASGLPVVATDHASVRAYLPNEEGILVAGNRVEGFVAAIKRLQKDPELRRKMGLRSRARAEELSWPNIIKQYDAIYTRVQTPQESPAAPPPVRRRAASSTGRAHPQTQHLKERFQADSVLTPDSPLQDLDILGCALLEAGLMEEAASLFGGLSKSAPLDFLGYAGLARIAETQWKWNDAVKAIDKCLTLAPPEAQPRLISKKVIYLIQAGRVMQAKEALLTIREEFDGLLASARLSASFGAREEANQYWQSCITLFPDQPDGYLGRAAELIACGNYTEADAVLAHAMAVWPNRLEPKVLWARCATNAKNMTAAEVRWNAVMATGRWDADLRAAYARYLGLIGDRARAESYLNSSDASPVATADFYLEYHQASGNLPKAIQQARALADLQKQDILSRIREAALCMRHGALEELQTASNVLRELLKKSPDSAIIKAELAEVLIRLGMHEEAKQVLRTINSADKRTQFEVLRLWATLDDRNDQPGLEYWKSTFLDLGALAATKNFSPDLKRTAQYGLY